MKIYRFIPNLCEVVSRISFLCHCLFKIPILLLNRRENLF